MNAGGAAIVIATAEALGHIPEFMASLAFFLLDFGISRAEKIRVIGGQTSFLFTL